MTKHIPARFCIFDISNIEQKGDLEEPFSFFTFCLTFFNYFIIDNNNNNVNDTFTIVYIKVRRPIGVSGLLKFMSNHIPVQDSRAI